MVINGRMTKETRPKQSRGVWKLQKPQREWNERLGQGLLEAPAGSIAGQGGVGKGLSRLVGSSAWWWGLFRLKHFPRHRDEILVCQAFRTTPEGTCYGESSGAQRDLPWWSFLTTYMIQWHSGLAKKWASFECCIARYATISQQSALLFSARESPGTNDILKA